MLKDVGEKLPAAKKNSSVLYEGENAMAEMIPSSQG
jgi:hypothetical protein